MSEESEVDTSNDDHLLPIAPAPGLFRGFVKMPPVEGINGSVTAREASDATQPRLWLDVHEHAIRSATVLLTAEAAWKLADQLRALVENHYQGDARPKWARERE